MPISLQVFKVSASASLIMSRTKLQIMAQRAVEGDEEALAYLSLEESDVTWSTSTNLTWDTLCANYNFCAHVLVVASQLQLHTMRRTSRYALQSLTWIARHQYKKELSPVATTCKIEDLAEMISVIVDEVPPPNLNRDEDVATSSSPESESEEEPASKKIKKNKRKKKKKKKWRGLVPTTSAPDVAYPAVRPWSATSVDI